MNTNSAQINFEMAGEGTHFATNEFSAAIRVENGMKVSAIANSIGTSGSRRAQHQGMACFSAAENRVRNLPFLPTAVTRRKHKRQQLGS
jgi:hypothetical protein